MDENSSVWYRKIYLLPVLSVLHTYELTEEFKMEGNLIDEIDRLLQTYIKVPNFHFVKTNVKVVVKATYEPGTNLCSIIQDITTKYKLLIDVGVTSSDVITMSLREGIEWTL